MSCARTSTWTWPFRSPASPIRRGPAVSARIQPRLCSTPTARRTSWTTSMWSTPASSRASAPSIPPSPPWPTRSGSGSTCSPEARTRRRTHRKHPIRLARQDLVGGHRQPAFARYPAKAKPASDSSPMSSDTASINARWVNACGKFPRCWPVVVSISSAYSSRGPANVSSFWHRHARGRSRRSWPGRSPARTSRS